MENNIQITRLVDNDNAIAKQISTKDGNKLHKESCASVKNGESKSAEYKTFEDFRDYLTNIPGNECIVLGKFKHGIAARIVGSKEAQDVAKNMYNRSLENFEWHKEYQILCIDYDGSKLGDLTPVQVIAIINEALPGFADITKVIKYSSGAWISNGEHELLSTSNGFHIYFMIKNPACITKVFKGSKSILHRKLWLNGHGYIKNSRPKDRRTTAVTQMERSPYDNCIFSAERIIFEARPILKTPGLYKEKQEAFIIDGKNDYLDLSQYEQLSKEEEQRYSELVKAAKIENENTPYMIESRKIFEDHVRERVLSGNYKDRKEYKGLTTDEIVEKEYRDSQNAILMQDHEIRLASGDYVTVEEIQQDPKKYHGMGCYDPHEPEYSTRPIAIIYTEQKVPVISSRAHGGIIYRFSSETTENNGPDFSSKEYWLEHLYLVAYDKKDEIYHINGNKIEKYSHSGFNHRYSGYYVEIGDGDNIKKMPMSKWWMSRKDKKCIAGDGFAPGKPIIYLEHGELVINEYVPVILRHGFGVLSREEYEMAALPFVNHVQTMIHDNNESSILLDWLAYLIQNPNERPMFAPVITSQVRGVGKDMMTDIFSSMLGHNYSKKASIEDLSKGDGWGDMYYKSKLIVVSECGSSTDRYTIGNNIKNAITATTMQMNIKRGEVVFGNVYSGIIMFSNSNSPFRFDDGDRRFFVTRCDWTKVLADEYKENGYFKSLFDFYSDKVNLHGLYHYFLNREIRTNMKGDAPMTSTKRLLMESEPNDIEQFFIELDQHPCKYWTPTMINNLFINQSSENSNLEVDTINNKQFQHFLRQMTTLKKMKIKGRTERLKVIRIQDADKNHSEIRKNIEENWGVTTHTLHPFEDKLCNTSSTSSNIIDCACGEVYDDIGTVPSEEKAEYDDNYKYFENLESEKEDDYYGLDFKPSSRISVGRFEGIEI